MNLFIYDQPLSIQPKAGQASLRKCVTYTPTQEEFF